MATYNRILKLITLISCIFLLVSCTKGVTNEGKDQFPTDEEGYPKKVILIDGKSYELKNLGYNGLGDKLEIKVNKSTNESTKIVLPKVYPTHSWKLEGENNTLIKKHNLLELDIKEGDMGDGVSTQLQEFIINNKEMNDKLTFKWSNIDIKEDPYVVTIIFN